MKNKVDLIAFIALLISGLVCWGQSSVPGKPKSVSTAQVAHPPALADTDMVLTIVENHVGPVITKSTPGAEHNRFGFEGGSVVKVGDTYHLFPTEIPTAPRAVKTRMAHWASRDRIHWTRVSTLYESSGKFDGTDPRASLWSPMPIYDDADGRWNLFYVAYNCEPNTPTEWRNNFDGEIWRAVSKTKGPEGIGGPYEDAGVIMRPDSESEKWEGLQGTDSFFPYRVGSDWYAFYGSANTEKMPIKHWRVGLAKAPALAGPWKRIAELNPVDLEKVYQENPIVTRASDGTFIAVYARGFVSDNRTAMGYSTSRDGIHWSKGVGLDLQPTEKERWAEWINTPLGLIPEGNDTFTLFYSGAVFRPFYESIGVVTLKLQHRGIAKQNR